MTRYLEVKPGSISETIKKLSDDYQAIFKAELEKTGKGLAQMTDSEKKAFFNKIDKMHNAKSEMAQTMPAKKPEDTKTTMVVKPGAPAGQEKVIRIPKEKLADYKSKGYIEAESYIPEAKKIDELTAGQKKLPLALQKAIKAKEKNEDIASMNPNNSPQARDYTAREKDIKPKKNEPLSQVDLFLKKMKDPKFAAAFKLSQKKENTNEVTESFYDSDEYKNYLKQITSLSNDKVMARVNKKGDEAIAAIQAKIDAIRDQIKTKKAAEKNEEVEITEGGLKDIDVRKGDLKLAKDKREQLKNKYNAIMANTMKGDESTIADQIQKLDMSIKKQEQELIDIMKKGKESEKNEAVDPERVSNLNQKIASMTTKMSKLDMAKPESKTKEAILKSDITTAKLRLQDLMQKSANDMKKAVNEMNKAKQSYKSLKMSMKKEQEMNGKKKTLTDKPLTKIDVNPKIVG